MHRKTKRDRVWIKIFESILEQEEMKPSEIAEEIGASGQTVRSPLRVAEEAGLVYREADKGQIYYPKNIFDLFGIEKPSGGDTK